MGRCVIGVVWQGAAGVLSAEVAAGRRCQWDLSRRAEEEVRLVTVAVFWGVHFGWLKLAREKDCGLKGRMVWNGEGFVGCWLGLLMLGLGRDCGMREEDIGEGFVGYGLGWLMFDDLWNVG